MTKKSFIFLVLTFAIFSATGCETTKGFATGVALGVGSTMGGTTQGLGKDTYNAFNFLKAADNWMKENLW